MSMPNIADYYFFIFIIIIVITSDIIYIDLKVTVPNIADFYDSRITKKENDKTLV